MTPRPSRPLSVNFTHTTLTKALASRPTRHYPTESRPVAATRHVSRFALIMGGALLAGGAAVAAVSAGPTLLSRLAGPSPAVTKTDPETNRTTVNLTDPSCPNIGSAYQLKTPGNLTPEEGAKYVQASCERLLAQNAVYNLFPNNFTKYATGPQKQVEKSVSDQYDGRGWSTQIATYHSGDGRPYASVDAGLNLPLVAGSPLVGVDGTAVQFSALRDGDTLLLALHNPNQDQVPAFTMTENQRLLDVPVLRTFIQQSSIKAAARLSLPAKYYNDESLSGWRDLIPCQDDTAASCSRGTGTRG